MPDLLVVAVDGECLGQSMRVPDLRPVWMMMPPTRPMSVNLHDYDLMPRPETYHEVEVRGVCLLGSRREVRVGLLSVGLVPPPYLAIVESFVAQALGVAPLHRTMTP